MDNQDDIAPHLISLYRQLWRLRQEDLSLFCARYGVSDRARKILMTPPSSKTKTLLPVIVVKD